MTVLYLAGVLSPGRRSDWSPAAVQVEFVGRLIKSRLRYPPGLRQGLTRHLTPPIMRTRGPFAAGWGIAYPPTVFAKTNIIIRSPAMPTIHTA